MNTNERYMLRIIYVDDDYDECFLFAEALQRLGIRHKLFTASKCDELIRILHTEPVDLIFLDMNMPVKNGRDCLKELRLNDQWAQIPVVILTGAYNKYDVEEVYNLGAFLYVIKPYMHNDFVKMMSSLLSYEWHRNPKPTFKKFVIENTSELMQS